MNKKIVIGLLFCIAILVLVVFGVVVIVNVNSNANKKYDQCTKVKEMLQIIVKGNNLEANMNFVDNYKNDEINGIYTNMSNEELLEKGYVGYIQNTDYMIEFYNKIVVNQVKLLKEYEDTIEFSIYVKRPNLFKVMNECDSENVDNINYNFNETFINKMKSEDFEYEQGEYTIIVHKVENELKFEYTDEFKNMLYSENE